MSINPSKRSKESIELDTDRFKRTKLTEIDTDLPISSGQLESDPYLEETPSPFFESTFFDENSNHTFFDLTEPTSPLSPIEGLALSLGETSITPSTSTKWCRSENNDWLLEGETKDLLHGPAWPKDEIMKTKKLNNSLKRAIHRVLTEVLSTWSMPENASELLPLWFASPYSFHKYLFGKKLADEVNRDLNNKISNSEVVALDDLIKDDVNHLVKQQVLEEFKKTIKDRSDELSKEIHIHLDNAHKISGQLKNAVRSGQKCRAQAMWIGLERENRAQVEKYHLKRMVESQEQVDLGLKHNSFNHDEYIRVDQLMHRICAPTNQNKMISFIFWTKDSPNDNEPHWNKVFGGIVHGLHTMDKKFSEDNEEMEKEMEAMTLHLKSSVSNPIPRKRMVQDGVMVKGSGPQASFSIGYNAQVPVPKTTSSNPTKATIAQINNAKQVRLAMKKVLPIMQARCHLFLSGFLPPFAEIALSLTRTSPTMMNALGLPNLSSFGTFAYCASSHTDKDDSATCGYVMKRPPHVQRNESNFVWASHSLIVELNHHSWWFWNAPEDEHGTTMNSLALKHPDSYKSHMTNEDAKERAQWTRAFVIPHAVSKAHQHEKSDQ